MTKLLRNLMAATLGTALLTFTGQAKKPGGTGSPSKVLVIAEFSGSIQTDGAPYADENLSGGWANMPGTGNFTLQLDGSGQAERYLQMDFTSRIADPENPNVTPFFYHDDADALIPIFLSMNRVCGVEEYDVETEECSTTATSEGSLKAMTFGGNDILVNFRSSFPDPLVNKASLTVHCGPVPSTRTNDNPYVSTPDAIRATCVKGRSNDNACLEWHLSPYTLDGASLRCQALRRESSKGRFTYTDLGVYDMPFSLILRRDANGNGVPDCEDSPTECVGAP